MKIIKFIKHAFVIGITVVFGIVGGSKLYDMMNNVESISYANSFDEYLLTNSDSEYLTKEDLEDMKDDDILLKYARNEIYARHGRRFLSKDLQEYFDELDWYKGTITPENFDENILNKYEKENVELIQQLEKEVSKKSPYDRKDSVREMKKGLPYSVELEENEKHELKYKLYSENGGYTGVKIYADDKVVENIKPYDEYNPKTYPTWRYIIHLITLKQNNRILLTVTDREDMDMQGFFYVYEYRDNKLILLADLVQLNAQRPENSQKYYKEEKYLFHSVYNIETLSVQEDEIVIRWKCATSVTGNIGMDVSYKVMENGIERADREVPLVLSVHIDEDEREDFDFIWTAREPMTVYTKISGNKKAFSIKSGEKVVVHSIRFKNKKCYISLKKDNQIGWMENPPEGESEISPYQYFEEGRFAG